MPVSVGLGAPHWEQHARGSIFGPTRESTAGHLAGAALESIAYQVADLPSAMQRDADAPLPELRVGGGAVVNETLLQLQGDILGIPVVQPAIMETTALGAAYLAAIASGFWHDGSAMAAMSLTGKRFEPHRPRARPAASGGRWSPVVSRVKGWENPHV